MEYQPEFEQSLGQLSRDQFSMLMTVTRDLAQKAKWLKQQHPDYTALEEIGWVFEEFDGFANDYFGLICALVPDDHPRQYQALRKLQQELFSLRMLVDHRASNTLRDWLWLADTIATSILSEAINFEVLEAKQYRRQSTIYISNRKDLSDRCLTIFEEVHLVRLGTFAYNRSPTVSLPLASAEHPWLWLGIAHEIAHFVFNNYELPGQILLNQFIHQQIFAVLSRMYVNPAERTHVAAPPMRVSAWPTQFPSGAVGRKSYLQTCWDP